MSKRIVGFLEITGFVFLAIITVPLFIILTVIFSFLSFFYGLMVRLFWYPRGMNTLILYSDPVWKEYVETKLTQSISGKYQLLNWSQRNEWSWKEQFLSLAVLYHWVRQNHNLKKDRAKIQERQHPVALVFIPWWNPKRFQFRGALGQHGQGKSAALQKLEQEFIRLVNS